MAMFAKIIERQRITRDTPLSRAQFSPLLRGDWKTVRGGM